jgi:cytochrome b561
MANKIKPETYGRVTQIIHWISALLIIGLLIFGTVMTRLADGAAKTQMYQSHVLIGLTVLVLTVIRLVWRFVEPWPDAPPGLSANRARAFKWNHILLYVFLIPLLVSGVSMLLLSNLGLSPGNVLPEAIQDVPPRTFHDIGSKLVLLLFLMHVVGTIQYQITKGDTLGRIGLPWFKKK